MVSRKAIRQGIYERLNVAAITSLLAEGSASLFHARARDEAPHPFVIFNKQAGTATHRGFGKTTAGTATITGSARGLPIDNHLWLVKAVVADSTSNVAEDIIAAVDARLDYGPLSVSGATTLHLARESDVDYIEQVGDQQYRHHGAIYRLMVA